MASGDGCSGFDNLDGVAEIFDDPSETPIKGPEKKFYFYKIFFPPENVFYTRFSPFALVNTSVAQKFVNVGR